MGKEQENDKMEWDWVNNRVDKPRQNGATMVIDTGLGERAFHDMLEISGRYIDFVKLGFGTAAITPLRVLKRKLTLAEQYDVCLFPGGTFFEVAYANGKWETYLLKLEQLGFQAVEVSEGTLSLPQSMRHKIIQTASQAFLVLSEVGRKERGSGITLNLLQEAYERDLSDGASYVIVEGRESGKNVGIYDERGEFDPRFVLKARELTGPAIMWEAPLKSQQAGLIRLLGPDINLGNVAAKDALAAEALRRGLRSDTFFLSRFDKVLL